jgi:hypothetical protein
MGCLPTAGEGGQQSPMVTAGDSEAAHRAGRQVFVDQDMVDRKQWRDLTVGRVGRKPTSPSDVGSTLQSEAVQRWCHPNDFKAVSAAGVVWLKITRSACAARSATSRVSDSLWDMFRIISRSSGLAAAR